MSVRFGITWRAVPGYNGLYEVSERGEVRSLERWDANGVRVSSRILKQSSRGTVTLSKNGKRQSVTVSRIVDEVFPRYQGVRA